MNNNVVLAYFLGMAIIFSAPAESNGGKIEYLFDVRVLYFWVSLLRKSVVAIVHLYILIDCKCNETVMDGYGLCRKRSSRLGGNYLCAVDNDSNCTDVVPEPRSGIYVSVEACKNKNLGEMLSNFAFLVFTNKKSP